MLKKWICTAAAAALLLAGSSVRARAGENYGEILVWLRSHEEIVSEGSLEIYQAGIPVPEGYLLGEEFGGGLIAGEDVLSPSFALWMADKAGKGWTASADRNGLVRFENLEPGLYLIRQAQEAEDFLPIDPFLACVSEELSRIDTYPRITGRRQPPATAQSLGLYLGVLGISLSLSGLLIVSQCLRREEG